MGILCKKMFFLYSFIIKIIPGIHTASPNGMENDDIIDKSMTKIVFLKLRSLFKKYIDVAIQSAGKYQIRIV